MTRFLALNHVTVLPYCNYGFLSLSSNLKTFDTGVEQPCYIVILQIMWTEQIVFRESFRQIYELMDKLPIIAFKKI